MRPRLDDEQTRLAVALVAALAAVLAVRHTPLLAADWRNVLHDGVARFGEAGGQRRDESGRRVEAPDRAVVGVADRDGPVRQLRDAQRMLQQRLLGSAVPMAEVEEPRPDVGAQHWTGGSRRDRAQGGGLGVGDPDQGAVCGRGQTGRLGEPPLGRSAVAQTFLRGSREDGDGRSLRVGREVQLPELVVAGHRDDDAVAPPHEVPRGRQVLVEGTPASGAPAKRGAGAGDDTNSPVAEADRRYLVVDGVGDEQVISDVSGNLRRQGQQPLRLVEDLSRAPPRALGLEVTLEVDDMVVRRVGDDDAAVGQGDELAGEGQGRLPRRCGRYGLSPTRSVPFSRCSATSSPTSAVSPGPWPSPDIEATTYPSGSITARVGQARAV